MPSPSAIQDEDLDVQTGLERRTESRAPVVSPRELAMQEMERSRIAEFNKETGSNVEFVPDASLITDPDANADDAEAERVRAKLAADGTLGTARVQDEVQEVDQVSQQLSEDLIADPSSKKVRVKVNGVEQDVELSTVLRTFQKDAAADQRLEEASATLRKAREEAERIRAEAATAAPAAAKPDTAPADRSAVAKEITAAFFSGDEDRATELLTQALSGAPSQGTRAGDVDVGSVAAAVRQQLKEETALSEFAESYPKLVESPRLATLADIEINSLMEGGMSKADAILEAGKTLYAEFGFTTPGRTKQPDTSTGDMSERLARKRAAATNAVPVRSAAAPGNSDVDQEESAARASAIADLAASRPNHVA